MGSHVLVFFLAFAAATAKVAKLEPWMKMFREGLEDFVHYQPQQTHLSVNEDGRKVVVTWATWNETDSLVEFGRDPLRLGWRADGHSRAFVDGGSEKRTQFIHRVELSGLEPNTTYFYHCGSDLGWSDLFWFNTFDSYDSDWSPTVVLFGDMGNANAQSLPRLQKETQADMYDMIIHVGDIAYDLDTENGRIGDEFMRQIEAIAAYVPYMTCVGNHESAYNFSHYKNRFSMPGGTENMFFSFDVGPVHFVAISTEFYYFTNYGMKMVANQYKWIVQDLENANKPENRAKRPWIIIFGHRPMYCSTHDSDDCTRTNAYTRVGLPVIHLYGLEDLLFKYSVDVAFWAHEHNYERHWPVYNYTIRKGSEAEPYTEPGATVHITTGSAGCQEAHDPWLPQPNITVFRSNDYGYTRVKAHNGTHLEIEQVSDDKDGAIIDHFMIVNHKHKFRAAD